MFEKYVRENDCLSRVNELEIVVWFSDGNHFNENWLQKIRLDASDNYRIKVRSEMDDDLSSIDLSSLGE